MTQPLKKLQNILIVWRTIQKFIDVKGGVVLGMWSVGLFALACFCLVTGRSFQTSIAGVYATLVSAYAYSRKEKKDDSSDNS